MVIALVSQPRRVWRLARKIITVEVPYFDGTNFASWKYKIKIHILGHNPAVWAIVCIGLQGEFFDGREPNREASADELKML